MSETYQKTCARAKENFDRIQECERKTIEKIAVCEELLKTKVDRSHVDSEISNLREYIDRYVSAYL